MLRPSAFGPWILRLSLVVTAVVAAAAAQSLAPEQKSPSRPRVYRMPQPVPQFFPQLNERIVIQGNAIELARQSPQLPGAQRLEELLREMKPGIDAATGIIVIPRRVSLEPEIAGGDAEEMNAVRSACEAGDTPRFVVSFLREPVTPEQKRVRVTYFVERATCKVTRKTYELVAVFLPVNGR